MYGYKINDVINKHIYIGPAVLRPYKEIIQKSAYPPFNSSEALDIAMHAVEAYETSGGDLFGLIELKVFLLECGTHFASDFGGDMGEDFYEILENLFEATLKQIKANDKKLFETYKSRLKAIIETAQDTGWGYGDQLVYYWEEAFGKDAI